MIIWYVLHVTPADTPRCFKMGMWYEGYGKCTEIEGNLS